MLQQPTPGTPTQSRERGHWKRQMQDRDTHPDPASRQQEDAVKFGLLGKEWEGEEMEEFR